MTSLDLQRQQMQQQQMGRYGGPRQSGMQSQLQGLQDQQRQGMGQGLPQGGLDAQLQSINNYYDQFQRPEVGKFKPGYSLTSNIVKGGARLYSGVNKMGFNAKEWLYDQYGGQAMESKVGRQEGRAENDLNALARKLSESYGLDLGRGQLVTDQGILMMTPEQVASQSGGRVTKGEAAAKMNYISAAISREQTMQGQRQGIASLQAGMGQVQKRGRGSLAAMQSGFYQDLADMYSNQEFEVVDYTFWIEQEQRDLTNELRRRAEKAKKKAARFQTIASIGMIIGSAYQGDIGGVAEGAGMMSQSVGETGWF